MRKTTENPNPEPQALKAVLCLDAGRIIPMQFGKRVYTWTFRRILREDWEKFFRSFDTETVYILGEQTETFETESGMIDLARTCVASVEGYKLPEGKADWRAMLPLGHLKAFGWALRDVQQTPPSDDAELTLTELSEVSLDCTWSRNTDGQMQRWTGLVHRFRPPTLAQQRKFNRACGTYRVMGNDRGNKTVFPAKQALMMDFYDDLIESVDESYTVNLQPLADIPSIVREMDACHKVSAVQALLNAGGAGRAPDAKKDGDGKK